MEEALQEILICKLGGEPRSRLCLDSFVLGQFPYESDLSESWFSYLIK